jgi:hypothetical protein
MTPVDIPLLVNIVVAIGICLLTISVVYFALIVGHKILDLGEKEEIELYGRKAKPIFGRY